METVFEPAVISGVVVMILIEIFKFAYRRLVVKDLDYTFPPYFYVITVPVLNVLIQPLMAFLMPESFSFPADWIGWARLIVLTALASASTFFTNDVVFSGLKDAFLLKRVGTDDTVEC